MKKLISAYILSALILTGCGEKIVQSPVSDSAVPAMAEIDETTEPERSEDFLTEPPQGIVIEITEPVEVYEKVTVKDVVSHVGLQLENGSQTLDTSEIGKGKVEVEYIYEGKKYKHEVDYTVADTTPPVLLNSGDGSSVMVGESFDINDYVGYADNYDSIPEFTYTGEVDTSTVGSYYLSASATDSSGNETVWDLEVNVTDTEDEYVDDNERLSFEELIAEYGDENTVFGIDVSRWQGEIDFEAVKNAGCEFVIMRIGSYYEEYTVDSYFYQNMENARDVGLKVGVYIYTTANTEEKVRDNVQWIMDILDGQPLDFPVVFDWEEFSNFQQYEMSIHDLNEYYEIFGEELEKYGYDSMLYSSKNFFNNFWYERTGEPIWLAHFIDRTDYNGDYDIWQMSCYGKIAGIEGDVDLNILYKDKADFYN